MGRIGANLFLATAGRYMKAQRLEPNACQHRGPRPRNGWLRSKPIPSRVPSSKAHISMNFNILAQPHWQALAGMPSFAGVLLKSLTQVWPCARTNKNSNPHVLNFARLADWLSKSFCRSL